MPKNSLYAGQKINVSEPGLQEPPEHIECPEDCPHCPKTRHPENCTEIECIYDIEEDEDNPFRARREEW